MSAKSYLQEAVKFQIQAYKKPKDIYTLWKTHVSFSGSPQKHPYDPDKVILIADPFSANNFYYEFNKNDVAYVEELPNVVNLEGDTLPGVRIWVKKMSVGVRCSPFIVEDTRNKF